VPGAPLSAVSGQLSCWGVAICDGYKAYDTLARQREGSDLTLAHCWAHLRRTFVEAEPHDPEAAEMFDRIG